MSNYYPMLKYGGGSGSGTAVLTGDATAADVASPKTFYNTDANNAVTGTMPHYTSNVTVPVGAIEQIQPGYHEHRYIGESLYSYTRASADEANILPGNYGWVDGQKVIGQGYYINSNKMEISGNIDPDEENKNIRNFRINTNLEIKNSSNQKNFKVGSNQGFNKYMTFTKGMTYWKKGLVNGTLVADSSHKIYFPKGSVFFMTIYAYNNTTGKYQGVKAYTITTTGGFTSTTAAAVPKLTAVSANGEPVKLTLGADKLGPEELYTIDADYAGFMVIGSCGTACRLEYAITPLLTPLPNFNISYNPITIT